jgi:hypothetical protein
MSISLVAAELEAAGVPRSHRHIIRLCRSGSLEASKYPGATGEEWFVAPNSVPKVIGDLRALDEARARRSAPQHDASHHVVVETAPRIEPDVARRSTTQHDVSDAQPSQPKSEMRPDTAGQQSETEPVTSRYVAQLEKRIEEKDDVIGMLRGELAQRNEEIVRRNERERETNILIRGLQNLVLQLQPGRTRAADVLEDDPLITKREQTPA